MILVWYLSLLILCLTFSTHGEAHLYKAEGLFLVDDETFQLYMREMSHVTDAERKREWAMQELYEDLDYTLSEVNKVISTLGSQNFNITMYVRHIEVLGSGTFQYSPVYGIPRYIDAEEAMEKLDSFLQLHNYYNTYHYDFAILFTRFDLVYKGSIGTAGLARLGMICHPSHAIAVIEYQGTYTTVLTTAHEIGHILGSEHDGPASQHIMNAYLKATSQYPWTFHPCSRIDIQQNINALRNQCLLTTDSASYQVTVNPPDYRGRMSNVDDICRRFYNYTNAYMPRETRYYNGLHPIGDSICLKVHCCLTNAFACQDTFASDGMMCNVRKGCEKGRCVLNKWTYENLDSDCLFGNQPIIQIGWFTGSCNEFMRYYGSSYCYQSFFKEICCDSCKARHTGITGCEYGDIYDRCSDFEKDAICVGKRYTCCNYCRDYDESSQSKRSSKALTLDQIAQIDNQVFMHLLYENLTFEEVKIPIDKIF